MINDEAFSMICSTIHSLRRGVGGRESLEGEERGMLINGNGKYMEGCEGVNVSKSSGLFLRKVNEGEEKRRSGGELDLLDKPRCVLGYASWVLGVYIDNESTMALFLEKEGHGFGL
ncbi:hypothetical protein H0E87_012085 [Populus deltoides]|uniref:Uncharacterized protein n=1 Tax=Populus deltoides TaxID=3696 RepID=A0A8T2YI98_POPDE|nr:hypothetical protein H0E87_012085 [Populus deltoides]